MRLARQAGTPAAQVARELGGSQDTLRGWIKQATIDAGQQEGMATDERQELTHLWRRVRISVSDPVATPAADLVERAFAPAVVGGPDRVWVADVSFVATGEGWLYLAGAQLRAAGLVASMGSVGDCFDRPEGPRRRRELFRHAQSRVALSRHVGHQRRRMQRHLPFHRDVVQHPPPALHPWLSQPGRL